MHMWRAWPFLQLALARGSFAAHVRTQMSSALTDGVARRPGNTIRRAFRFYIACLRETCHATCAKPRYVGWPAAILSARVAEAITGVHNAFIRTCVRVGTLRSGPRPLLRPGPPLCTCALSAISQATSRAFARTQQMNIFLCALTWLFRVLGIAQ